jgi:DNA-binding transcriptional ArsR family regulator
MNRTSSTGSSPKVFAALADPTRRDLIDRLATSGPSSASVLAGDYAVTRQAIVKHLGVLLDAGIVSTERHGNEVRFQVVPGSLHSATLWLERVGGEWDERLAALEKRVGRR